MSNIFYFHFDGNLIAGDNFDIHDNQSVNIYQGQQSPTTAPRSSETVVEDVTPADSSADVPAEEIPLFKYIHPSVTADSDKRQVHCEVRNLVQQFPMLDICRYLRQMCKENRVYLNVKPEAMFTELHRMGMPDESTPGYSYKNFMNYFNVNN
ncbi:MAG: hypothetical protein IJQ32_00110 [Paludibacteraceae bacterium]|nr:hypothetical protein [Paludibacteraceae bacterium]